MQGKIFFTLEELKGVPEDVVSGYEKKTEGPVTTYGVTHKTPDIFPLVGDKVERSEYAADSLVVQICPKSGNPEKSVLEL